MSIYCSFAMFDGEDLDDDGEPQPYIYRQSHVIPTPDDPRGGTLNLGYIPGFITRDGHDNGNPEGTDNIWPYLRVCLMGSRDEPGTIILDNQQVAALRDHLDWWLSRAAPFRR